LSIPDWVSEQAQGTVVRWLALVQVVHLSVPEQQKCPGEEPVAVVRMRMRMRMRMQMQMQMQMQIQRWRCLWAWAQLVAKEV
jgi:hypothetical protein